MSDSGNWDHSVDILIIGSGAGAMTTAICAHDRGAGTLIIEKTDQYGGSSAMSGGSLWIPNNHLMSPAGIDDSREDALAYLKHITRGEVADEKLEEYVDVAPEMMRYMTEKTQLELVCMPKYADYYPESPGGRPGGRSCEADHFDAKLLGDEFEQLRPSAPQELVLNRMSMTATEGRVILTGAPGWIGMTVKMMLRYWLDIGWRMRTNRDRTLSLGNALVGMLRRSMMDRDLPLWLNTPAKDLVVENGTVVGVVAERGGKTIRIRGERGVVLAAGGFESSSAMRKKYLPNPTEADWTVANPGNTGDLINLGMGIGAGVDLMDDAWWGPTTVVPGEDRARMLVVEKGLPGSVFVNKRGERFMNEAMPYNDICKAMYANHSEESPSVPCYMIFDATYRKKYPCGPMLPGAQQPDFFLPKKLSETGYIKKANTLRDLAAQLGVDANNLEKTVAKMNLYAGTGKDLDFNRGESVFDQYYGDANVKPNSCLAPIETAPYYGLVVYAGDLGTKGGLRVDKHARVLKESGEPIGGLYAIGNCSASVMGRTYPGAGGTIGPAMTFGYVVARHLAGAAQQEQNLQQAAS
jgi:3-oxosteroid 1-dehydrogenase